MCHIPRASRGQYAMLRAGQNRDRSGYTRPEKGVTGAIKHQLAEDQAIPDVYAEKPRHDPMDRDLS
ncbi:hypothetical protein KSB_61870 [Ktedonobacter robiniae]|uniref:Uncharacterized protein n=1 Tax=Ktedonobacter robiniae TaxID=2778365 RepID=A0ABQ3UYH5_9CHLR|nr:hypothetical protein KSB_61870 [Ktedonobacter robiniae]